MVFAKFQICFASETAYAQLAGDCKDVKADKEWAWQQSQLQMVVYSGHLSSRYYWLLKDRE